MKPAPETVFTRHFPGDPDRPAIALHPMLGSSAIWTGVAGFLGGMVDLYAFDFPGHGRSAPHQTVQEGGSVDLHTKATHILAGMIDRPVDLIGHSFGATVALRLAVGAPEAVRSLTLIEPVLFAASPTPDAGQEGLMAQMQAAPHPHEQARAFMNVWGGDFAQMPPQIQTIISGQMPLVRESQAALYQDCHNILRAGGLEGIDAPVMFITGENSPAVARDVAQRLAARIADVGVATIPGAGHMMPLTHPKETAGLIAANLERAA